MLPSNQTSPSLQFSFDNSTNTWSVFIFSLACSYALAGYSVSVGICSITFFSQRRLHLRHCESHILLPQHLAGPEYAIFIFRVSGERDPIGIRRISFILPHLPISQATPRAERGTAGRATSRRPFVTVAQSPHAVPYHATIARSNRRPSSSGPADRGESFVTRCCGSVPSTRAGMFAMV
jgi:hypothetical protein